MRGGSIKAGKFHIRSSNYDHRLDACGWSFPNKEESFDEIKNAFSRFNELVADPEVAKAELVWTVSYEQSSGEKFPRTLSTSSSFVIAHYDHKAICFENSSNHWETNRKWIDNIPNRYQKDLQDDPEEPKTFKKIKLNE